MAVAEALGVEALPMTYESLLAAYLGARRGAAYVEDVWLYLKAWRAPPPPWELPAEERWVVGRMLPILGNLQVLVSNVGRLSREELLVLIEERPRSLALFARPGEPAATDLFLPLYAAYCDAERALEAARRLREAGSVHTDREDFLRALRRVDAAFAWSSWVGDAEMYPHPATGSANLGFWGITATVDLGRLVDRLERLYAEGIPPPYPELAEPRYAELLRGARHFRGPTWMSVLYALADAVWRYANGEAGAEAVATVRWALERGAVSVCER